MKGFIVLVLTISATLAAPQYNYAQPGGGSFGGLSGGGFGGSSGHGGFGGSSGHGGFGGSSGHGGFGGSSGGGGFGGLSGGGGFGGSSGGGAFGGSFGGSSGGFSGGSGGFGGSFGGSSSQEAIVSKQFFIHSAPEEQDEIGGDKVINLGPGRKNYRVVFIKAPHQGVQAGKVRLVAPADEEKTVIYVLSKKTDVSDIQADVQQAHSEPTKPEVHFIKYKTNEEAAHAQQTIQAQYDSIQGTSQVSDEGVAPISSVIGALGDSGHGGAGGAGGFSGGHGGAGGFSSGHGGSSGGHGGSSGGHGGSSGGFIGASSNTFGTSAGGVSSSYLPPNH